MKLLQKEDLNLVKPSLRKTVQEAWDKGEDVPYGVIYLSNDPLPESVIKRAKELNEKYHWEV